MSDEMLKLAEIIEDCVKCAIDDMGESIHELSLFCTTEQDLAALPKEEAA